MSEDMTADEFAAFIRAARHVPRISDERMREIFAELRRRDQEAPTAPFTNRVSD